MEDRKQLFFQDEPQRVRKIPAKLRVKLAFEKVVETSETSISIKKNRMDEIRTKKLLKHKMNVASKQ